MIISLIGKYNHLHKIIDALQTPEVISQTPGVISQTPGVISQTQILSAKLQGLSAKLKFYQPKQRGYQPKQHQKCLSASLQSSNFQTNTSTSTLKLQISTLNKKTNTY